VPVEHAPFMTALRALRGLNQMANLVNLPCGPYGYSLAIRIWREAWQDLRRHTGNTVSETNSIHTILAHLEDYYDLTGESLVKTTDHVVEQAHQWLHQELRKTNLWVRDLESPKHGERLFRAVMRHNTYTVRAMRIEVRQPQAPQQAAPQPQAPQQEAPQP